MMGSFFQKKKKKQEKQSDVLSKVINLIVIFNVSSIIGQTFSTLLSVNHIIYYFSFLTHFLKERRGPVRKISTLSDGHVAETKELIDLVAAFEETVMKKLDEVMRKVTVCVFGVDSIS